MNEEEPTLLTSSNTELDPMTISEYIDLVNDDEFKELAA